MPSEVRDIELESAQGEREVWFWVESAETR